MNPRADIQGLRAIAVGIVVLYHLLPQRLSGGFVGVDVFFVISGFLITSHLLARPPRRTGDLIAFLGRRIRRLLPASLLVLAVTLVASRLFLPETRWADTAAQVKAAALYSVNWRLAHDAVDYLAAANAASPVQHFWSLSLEEQFYLGWPVLILVLGWLGLRVRRSGTVLAFGLGLVVAASFGWSIHLTASNPAAAYFVTTTRVWELGAGGLLALGQTRLASPRLPMGWRRGMVFGGLAVLALVATTFDAATPFPGWRAAVPVLATVVVIAADADLMGWSPVRLLALRPMRWLGDVSYAVYLWHWPLIVLLPAALGAARGRVDDVVIVILTLILAAATKRLVEDPFRGRAWTLRTRRTYALGAAAMTVVVALTAALTAEVGHRQDVEAARLAAALTGHDRCFGAQALDPGRACPPSSADPVPAPALAAKEQDAYTKTAGSDCWASYPTFVMRVCDFGRRDSGITVALVGNSHAGQWLPALQRLAGQRGWHITTYLAEGCSMADLLQEFPGAGAAEACRRWATSTAAKVEADAPDAVVFANRVSSPAVGHTVAESQPLYAAGLHRILARWHRIPVVALRDTPAPKDGGRISIPNCVALHLHEWKHCGADRSAWVPTDPVVAAAADLTNVRVLDLNDHICGEKRCEAVVGGVLVYVDGSHLTATYAQTLAPYLAPALSAALRHA
ncbi:acyltransferase family protein [Nocardioides sp. Iso805N]|uniref:acyltransferase family protein n=1 Tax=Nocardioides sp. Iso805N TaxID=1283287 RepID=UPI0003807A05|nr:acyltransferase family protein [Nocardioides sp. Iso805N]